MAYNESTADRVRQQLVGREGFEEKRMFGGLGFLMHGHMCVGLWGPRNAQADEEYLLVRVGVDEYEAALAQPHARVFDITGRAMKGWVMIAPAGYAADSDLARWTDQAITFVRDLPGKE